MRPHRAFNSPADYRLPRLPEVYRMPVTDTSVFRTRRGGPLYKHHDRSVALAILLLKKTSYEAEYIHLSVIFRP